MEAITQSLLVSIESSCRKPFHFPQQTADMASIYTITIMPTAPRASCCLSETVDQ